jgi:nucleoid-associated protein YgaU
MNPFVTLTLDTPNGTFTFSGAEVPENIPFGGSQLLDVQKMIGGRRRVNAMGGDDDPLQWSGLFLYASALSRARFLDSVRREGLQCTLSWDELRYQVTIAEFHPNYKYPFRIPYTIRFEVVQDETATIDSVPAITPAQSITTDMARMGTLSNCIGDSTLNGLAGDLQSAISAVTSAAQPIANGLKAVTSFVSGVANCADQVVNTVASAVASVTAPLAAVASRVQSLIAGAEETMATGSGVLPGLPASTVVFNALAQTNAAVQLPELYELQSICARMQVNLPLISTPSSPKTITVGGGDLYSIASQQYGDATRWTDIAAANGLTDPVLTGFNTLIIPA